MNLLIIGTGFLLSLSMLFIQSALLPTLSLFAFAPFIALLNMYLNRSKSLWLAACVGILHDLVHTFPFGLGAINFVVVSFLSRRYHLRTFKEQPFQLCSSTMLIALAMVLVQYCLMFLLDHRMVFAKNTLFLELLEVMFVNGIYAFVWFVGPILTVEWIQKKWMQWRMINNDSS